MCCLFKDRYLINNINYFVLDKITHNGVLNLLFLFLKPGKYNLYLCKTIYFHEFLNLSHFSVIVLCLLKLQGVYKISICLAFDILYQKLLFYRAYSYFVTSYVKDITVMLNYDKSKSKIMSFVFTQKQSYLFRWMLLIFFYLI